ncbi:MAG TPA: c-type cytochrome [Burkholderiaceae bacterium]|jgi:cytochrome c553|nr:c-type cytochrome [Burkholderiaceae bacterium]
MLARTIGRVRLVLLFAALATMPAARGADALAGGSKAAVCAACHGADGNSTNPLYPSLAGQTPLYIYYQLLQFREQRRVNEQMSPFASKLTDTDMKDIAAYYSSQERALGTAQPADEARSAAGKAVVAANHCDSCHTPNFAGQNHIPRIAGLQYEYLVRQLRGFKTGERADIDGSMTSAAQPLSDQDITAVSWYLAGLH